MSTITSTDIKPLRTALLQNFRTSLGAHEQLDNLLLTVTLDNGIEGYGEAAVATHITGEPYEGTWKALHRACGFCEGRRIGKFKDISARLHETFPQNPSVIAAVETALLDGFTRAKCIPLWRYFGRKCRKLQSDITIVLSDLEETQASARRFYAQGFRTFKVKVGHDLDLDLKRLMAVHTIAPDGRILVDANQGYTVDGTLMFLKMCKDNDIPIDLLEQPVAKDDWEGLKKITRSTRILVCADESVCTPQDARKAIKFKLASAINIKIMKCGMLDAQEIARLARRKRIKLMIGGMMETSVAMTGAAHLAAGLGVFDFVDLDTPFFIRGAAERNPYLSADGCYDLQDVEAGIGIGPAQLYDQ